MDINKYYGFSLFFRLI